MNQLGDSLKDVMAIVMASQNHPFPERYPPEIAGLKIRAYENHWFPEKGRL